MQTSSVDNGAKRGHAPTRRRRTLLAVAVTLVLAAVGAVPAATAAPVTGTVDIPRHSAVVAAMKRAADLYGPTSALASSSRNGWSWATYFDGDLHLFRTAGDQRYLEQAVRWGASTGWSVPCSTSLNPDCIKAGQVYHDLGRLDPRPSLAAMDSQMGTDLHGLPLRQYYWVDALYMGLPNWAHWARRTGDPAYLEKMDALFAHVRDDGLTTVFPCAGKAPGLYDAAERLWYRDCRFVGARDASGSKIFWARGNGWVIAAMAQVLQALPPSDARAAKYRDMLVGMADRLRTLQGTDGLWRSSLLNPSAYPAPETSATGLIAYAIGYGVRAGLLDRATYVPVLDRAWRGLTTVSMQPSGFVSYCQPVGAQPGAGYTGTAPRTAPTATSAGTLHADSPPYCVGALLLAGSELARLTGALSSGRRTSATAQQAGNEAPRAVDGDMTTRWSAAGFPQSLTVDLGGPRLVSNVQVVPHLDRPYRYRVETSTDGATWTTAVDRTANTTAGTLLDDLPQAAEARYVRLTVTGIAGGGTSWVSIRELSVHDRYDPRPNLALRRPATATSSAGSGAPGNAVDHSSATAWTSAAVPSTAAPQRLTVDLGAAKTVDTVRVQSRGGSGPRGVAVQGSTDGSTWTTLATSTLPDRQGPHTWVVPPAAVRWVRLSTASAYGAAGAAIEEMEVFGR